MPAGLPIDHSKPLSGTMAPYAEQVLVCTGNDDWLSNIEDENSGDNLAADIKELMGRGGTYSDPYHKVLITNTSLPSSIPSRSEVQTTSALTRAEDRGFLYGVQDVKGVMVLICGHGGRDMRCGVLGPVLREEFERRLDEEDFHVLKGPVDLGDEQKRETIEAEGNISGTSARVGLISHIGGHKFAGNVILYLPPGLKKRDGKPNELAGCGIWYGRVEPKHVEGIVRKTVLGGKVIEDLFRGGIRQGGEILRL
ncbi:sucrose cleavage family protein [Drepanopeziza brunnea f. sp. 'multigermtubi' MB_m1]|uniref:Altered inheritance of mitochondria protein 32 n=1 Tax=Marssonina brunnea f. sp. multigermtubi (strain MB_m1) TaxID=1072389 RepID=K1W657_MARBU|nr:sucrose cleavage family protein [Drepanopeziza brunnea f. sp. 'multigermtubi' MB_m1]EKD12440.1 sucrose cleavage family protein [Drepanopeziza brunnea f. sp. 'multigermtubi' MB_m1]